MSRLERIIKCIDFIIVNKFLRGELINPKINKDISFRHVFNLNISVIINLDDIM